MGVKMERLAKTDLRVIKTKKAIRQAFAELMSRKPIEEISISDISAEALINRKTFYAHYASVDEILGNPSVFFNDLLQIINENIDVYGRLLTMNGNSGLVHKIVQITRRQICSAFERESPVDRQTLDTGVYFMLAGMLAVIAEWYSSGREQSIESLSDQLSRLCFNGIHGILGISG